MDIKVYFSAEAVGPRVATNRSVIVIDVLRATTTLTTALVNGAMRIIPIDSVSGAHMEFGRFPAGTALLCGERGFDKLEGFNLGNSPYEYNRDNVAGKTLVYTSTNGSQGITVGMTGKIMVLGAFRNFPRPADYLLDMKNDITVICCGTAGFFSLEDAVAGGMYVHYLSKNVRSVTTNDAAEAAVALFRRYRDSIPQMMQMCENGRQLAAMGYHGDVAYCSHIGQTEIVPVLKNNELVPLEPPL